MHKYLISVWQLLQINKCFSITIECLAMTSLPSFGNMREVLSILPETFSCNVFQDTAAVMEK